MVAGSALGAAVVGALVGPVGDRVVGEAIVDQFLNLFELFVVSNAVIIAFFVAVQPFGPLVAYHQRPQSANLQLYQLQLQVQAVQLLF